MVVIFWDVTSEGSKRAHVRVFRAESFLADDLFAIYSRYLREVTVRFFLFSPRIVVLHSTCICSFTGLHLEHRRT
jgi:hypothetical protein